eukprot:1305588-Prymnesium_polylepis.1
MTRVSPRMHGPPFFTRSRVAIPPGEQADDKQDSSSITAPAPAPKEDGPKQNGIKKKSFLSRKSLHGNVPATSEVKQGEDWQGVLDVDGTQYEVLIERKGTYVVA